ncbi:Vms1/Ankzf1 family peptidyl-tRNA hydrolase [Streptacidiphilus monticola]
MYVDTERAAPQAAHAIELRARAVSERLSEAGADPATIRVLVEQVGSDRGMPAPQGQALFAAGGELLARHELSAAPDRDLVCFGPLPHVLPLLRDRQCFVPYLLVRTDRVGADLEVHTSAVGAGEHREVHGDGEDIRKLPVGDWAQDRYQRRAENTWDRNARGVAAEAAALAAEHRVAVLVLAGDVRARTLVKEHLPSPWPQRLVELTSTAEAADRARSAAAVRALEQAAEVQRRLQAGLVDGRAVEGLLPVVSALRNGEVDTLVLAEAGEALSAQLRFGRSLGELALPEEQLGGMTEQAPGADALPFAAALSAARLAFAPPGSFAAGQGVAALLRRS